MKTASFKIAFLFLLISCKETSKENTIHRKDVKSKTVEIEKKDTLYNDENFLVIGDSKSKKFKIEVMSAVNYEKNKTKYKDFETIVQFNNDYDLVIAQNISYDEAEFYRKFIPAKKFSDYKVNLYKGKLANPNFSTCKGSYNYRTRIKEECNNGINFAGKYTLVYWGCGCPCQSNMIIDRETGKIYDGFHTSHGIKFEKNSKLLILDYYAIDSPTNLIKWTATSNVSLAIWEKGKLKTIQ